jgi:hypothetical protein
MLMNFVISEISTEPKIKLVEIPQLRNPKKILKI